MRVVRVTTNQGIEDIAAAEIARLVAVEGIDADAPCTKPWGLAGVVTMRIRDEDRSVGDLGRVLQRARSVYHVVIHVGEVTWAGETAQELAHRIASLPLTLMESAKSFRASCSRTGAHPFQSPDIEAALGSALQERYGTAVDLVNCDVNVRVDIVGNHCLCGYQLTGKKGLDRRYVWKYHPRVTLRTVVAYAMLDIAGYTQTPGDLLDPFCGSGTILLEAASIVPQERSVPVRMHAIRGSDIAERAIAGCRLNLDAAGFAGRVEVRRADARELIGVHPEGSFDYIVTNPPFGIRLLSGSDIAQLYREFLIQAEGLLRPGGVLALLVGKRRGRFNRILQATGSLVLEHVRIIEIGGVYPGLFVLRKSA